MRAKFSLLVLTLLTVLSCGRGVSDPVYSGRSPRIFPDYRDVTVPATIAPLNFSIDKAERLAVTLTGDDGTVLHIRGSMARFPQRAWRKLLRANTGASILVDTYEFVDGQWFQDAPFHIYVSEDTIDYGLAYRLILPS